MSAFHPPSRKRLNVRFRTKAATRCLLKRCDRYSFLALSQSLSQCVARMTAPATSTTPTTATTAVQRMIQRIHGRDYRVEVTQIALERWRAHVLNAHGGPTALMPFYATTADLAVTRLTDWLSLAHKQAEKPTAGTAAP